MKKVVLATMLMCAVVAAYPASNPGGINTSNYCNCQGRGVGNSDKSANLVPNTPKTKTWDRVDKEEVPVWVINFEQLVLFLVGYHFGR